MRTLILPFTILAVAGVAAAQPSWNFNPGGSVLSLTADAYADNYDNGINPGPFFSDTATRTTFIPGFTGGSNTFDFGNSANPRGTDLFTNFSRTSSSAVGVCTINGASSAMMDINFRANGLMDSLGPDGYDANSRANAAATLLLDIIGAASGQTLTVIYTWSYFGNAITDHEGVLEDPANSRGTLQITQPDGTLTTLFAEGFDGDDPAQPDSGSGSGSGTFTFNYFPGDSVTIDLTAFAQSFMRNPGTQGLFIEDLGGSEFLGSLQIEIVPSPGSLVLLAGAGATLLRRRRTGLTSISRM